MPPGREETLGVTAPHPFYVISRSAPGFVPAEELRPEDILQLANGDTAAVVSNQRQPAPDGPEFATYNFEVADFHTYFVGEAGVWVHNDGKSICDKIFSGIKALLRAGGPLEGKPWSAIERVAERLGKRVSSHGFAWGATEVMRTELQSLPLAERIAEWPSHAKIKAVMHKITGSTKEIDLAEGGTHFGNINVPLWLQQARRDLGSIFSFKLESHHGIPKKCQEWLGMTKNVDDVPAYLTTMLEHRGAEVGIHQKLAKKMGDLIGTGPVALNGTRPIALTPELIVQALEETYQAAGLAKFWEVCNDWRLSP